MSDNVIRIRQMGKMYRLYQKPLERVLDALGIGRLPFCRKVHYRQFWALRDISLNLKKGERIGIIGRNGAGKSTLLKIICGSLQPTEGTCEVDGRVQALIEMGTGFHPEFTGRQNIGASLAYQDISAAQIREAEREIIEFAELDDFIDQPVKTYSSGMYARLAFAVATSIRPDLLVIDEVLGAGDAYFMVKCAVQMKKLVREHNATVLLVSHSTDQILAYCEQCLWLERGQVVKQGPSMEVVNAYHEFIHELEDRKLKAKNLRRNRGVSSNDALERYGDALLLSFYQHGEPGAWCDISRVSLLRNGAVEDTLTVGGIQDADSAHTTFVDLNGSRWSEPQREDGAYFRRLAAPCNGDPPAVAHAVFYLYAVYPDAHYSVAVQFRQSADSRVDVGIHRGGGTFGEPALLACGGPQWSEQAIAIPGLSPQEECRPAEHRPTGPQPSPEKKALSLSRWAGEGSLIIAKVSLHDASGSEQTVFKAGGQLSMRITVKATRTGSFTVVPTATLYRMDGVYVANFIGEPCPLEMLEDEEASFRLDLAHLLLGDGHFVFSVAIFDKVVAGESRYDLMARCYEFAVVDNDPHHSSYVVVHPSSWQMPRERQLSHRGERAA